MLTYFEDDLEAVLDKTIACWKDVKDKTLFVTGGTGFFGIWLIMSFIYINRKLNLNSKLILLTRNKDSFIAKHPWITQYVEITFLEGDICSFEFIKDQIDFIIHAATEASVKLNLEKPLSMFETVVNGTKRILEFSRLKKVKSFLFTSSGAVYGKQPSEIENLTEDFIGAPIPADAASVYGEGKRMAEVLCAVYHKHYEVPVKIARCYAFMGPFLPLDTHFAAGNFINNLLNDQDIVIEGDGTPFRSYLYSSDLVIWLWTILFKGKNNYPYNVGSDESVTISQLAEMIALNNSIKPINVIIKKPLVGGLPQRYVPNVNRAVKELNLGIYTDLTTSIAKTIKFNKKLRHKIFSIMQHTDSDFHGIWRIMPSMTLTEIIGQSNFNFQILDCEHGAYDFQTLEQDIRICHLQNCKAYVRVSGLDKVEVQRCLDLGADGIVFPQLNDYDDFELATKMLQYAPIGVRGFNPFVRAGAYGYGNIHEKRPECIAIIETLQAVDELDRILTLSDLDMIYIGVYDLSAQLNCIGVMDSPALIAVVDVIIDKCIKTSKKVSLMVNNAAAYKNYKNKGVNYFVHTVDSHQLKTAFTNVLNNLNEGI